MNSITDRIEREIFLKASRSKVWNALANAEEFGKWFRVDFAGKRFEVGKTISGNMMYPGFEHLLAEMHIQSIDPEQSLSLRWHPYAINPDYDYSQEPTTLVEFHLHEADGGILLKVVESGFDQIPLSRRDEAFRMNSGGWEAQLRNIENHVSTSR